MRSTSFFWKKVTNAWPNVLIASPKLFGASTALAPGGSIRL